MITEWHGEKVFDKVSGATKDSVMEAGYFLEAKIKKRFQLQGQGKRYGDHKASRPGERPAVDDGHLRASIQTEVKRERMTLHGFVGSDKDIIQSRAEGGTDLEYGFYLEMGTKNMKARPYLRPALKKWRKRIKRILQRGIK